MIQMKVKMRLIGLGIVLAAACLMVNSAIANSNLQTSSLTPYYMFQNFSPTIAGGPSCHDAGINASDGHVQVTSASGTNVTRGQQFTVLLQVTGFTEAANQTIIMGFANGTGDRGQNRLFTYSVEQYNVSINAAGDSGICYYTLTAPTTPASYTIVGDAVDGNGGGTIYWSTGSLVIQVMGPSSVTPAFTVQAFFTNPYVFWTLIAVIIGIVALLASRFRTARTRQGLLNEEPLHDREKLDVKLKEYAGEAITKECSNCTMCRDECPTYYSRKAESYYAGGRLRILRAYAEKAYPVDDDFIETMYYCTTCKQCEDRCPVPVNYVEIIEGLRAKLVQNGIGPYGKQLSLSRNVYETKNPYGEKEECRVDWCMEGESVAEGIRTVERGPIAYFVGCTASFRTKSAAQNTARILSKLNPGGIVILGNGEYCCGSPLIRTGQEDFDLKTADGKIVRFRVKDLITHNIESMILKDVKEVVFSCSGCFKTSLDDWPRYYEKELPFKRTHITEYLARKIDEGAITLNSLDKTITYHDPCHLGRHRKVYDAPRKVITTIPGVNFVEMPFNRNRARCCGAGAGVKSGYPVDAVHMAKIRLQEAIDTGADILATSCVFCKYNFIDAAKEMNATIEILNIEDLAIDLIEVKPPPSSTD
jgi:heterodisulfide reductase subunit D